MTMDEAKEKPVVVLDTSTLNSFLIHVLFDSGATFSFVLVSLATQLATDLTPMSQSIAVELAN